MAAVRRTLLAAAVLLAICTPGAAAVARLAPRGGLASAAPAATLSASFAPERLGRRTTLSFGFQIDGGAGRVPPALTAVELSYPNYLGIALSGLGLAVCAEATLQAAGPAGCPANSVMGHGTARAEIALGPEVVQESAPITILRAADQEGHIAVLFSAIGTLPLAAGVVFPGVLLPAPAPFGGTLSIGVPLIASVPGAPNVALVQLRSTLGPSRVVYYEQVAGRTLAYQPPGILLPNSCPPGGFPFAADFSFEDGSHASAATAVPCPRRRRHRG
jgi:hypothetical protein